MNACMVLIVRPEGNRLLAINKLGWLDNIKNALEK
jgi:hypothetical protein